MLGRQNDGRKRIDVSSKIKKFLIILCNENAMSKTNK